MSESNNVPDEVKSFLRSVLISSNGVKESRVQHDYLELIGQRLTWKKYGFSSLNEFLNSLPDVCVLQYSVKAKENLVYGVQSEGVYLSKHAKKNAKTATQTVADIKETSVPFNGRIVKNDGDSFKITLVNHPHAGDDVDDIMPNKSGLYQVYITKIPDKCTEKDIRECFKSYGDVTECQLVRSSIGKKIGFVRYASKSQAICALTDGKKNPPWVHGFQLEVGKPKNKENNVETSMNTVLHSESSEGDFPSSPSSPIKPASHLPSSPSSPTKLASQLGAARQSPTKTVVSSPPPLQVQLSSKVPSSGQATSSAPRTLTPSNSQHPTPPNLQTQPSNDTQIPLSVQVPRSPPHTPEKLNTNTQGPWTLNARSPLKSLLSVEVPSQARPSNKNVSIILPLPATKNGDGILMGNPTHGVVITGYDNKLSEAYLKRMLQTVAKFEHLEYQPQYSKVWFNSEHEANCVMKELNGKYINGCVLLVKPVLNKVRPVLNNPKPVIPKDKPRNDIKPRNNVKEEKMPVFQDEFSKIYEMYSEVMSGWFGQQYQQWLNNLPSTFQVKIMDLIDPCTFWVHLFDGSNTYQEFNDLTRRLSYLNPSPGLKHLKKKELGAARFSEDDLWYRCYCSDASADGRQRLVMYVDYGNTEWLPQERTVELNDAFFSLRPQGVLVQLSGLRFKSNNDGSLDNSVFSAARKLLMSQLFVARKSSVDPSEPLLLEIELLQSKGEGVTEKVKCMPGVESRARESTLVPPLLLSVPPPVPTILKPLKDRLSKVDGPTHMIWITNINSPTSFHFQLVRDECSEAIRRIQEMLLKCNIQNKVNVNDPKMRDVVCYHKNGLERSRVTLVNPSSGLGNVIVLHVDTGKEAVVVPPTSFISLPAEARNIPYQARPAHLFGVHHHALALFAEALEFMIIQATKVLRAIVVEEKHDGSVLVELFNAEGTNVNKKLLEMAKELAPSDETYTQNKSLSCQNQTVPVDQRLAKQNHVDNAISRNSTQYRPAPPQNQAASNPSVVTSSSQSRVSSSHAGQASPIQTPSPVRVSPEQAFARTQASPTQNQAQAMTQNQALTNQGLKSGYQSSNQRLTQHHSDPPNQAFTENRAPPNQAPHLIQTSSTQGFTQQKVTRSPISPQQNVAPSQTSPNRSYAHNQVTHPNLGTKPVSDQAFGKASSNQTSGQKRSQSDQTFSQSLPQNRAQPRTAGTRDQAKPNQTFAQSLTTPTEGLPASAGKPNAPNNNYMNKQPGTQFPESRVASSTTAQRPLATESKGQAKGANSLPKSSFYNAERPITQLDPSTRNNDVTSDVSNTSHGMTSQAVVFKETATPRDASKTAADMGTEAHNSLTPTTVSQTITSGGVTSPGVTSQTTSSPTQYDRSRSDSCASSGSKKSLNSDEGWVELDKNLQQDSEKGQKVNGNSCRSGEQSQDSGPTSKVDTSKQSHKTGASKMGPTAKSIAPLAPGKGGKRTVFPTQGVAHKPPSKPLDEGGADMVNSQKFKNLSTKVFAQEKILACEGDELRQKVEMFKSREKLTLELRLKRLENENLLLQAEIKKNMVEKAELEKRLNGLKSSKVKT